MWISTKLMCNSWFRTSNSFQSNTVNGINISLRKRSPYLISKYFYTSDTYFSSASEMLTKTDLSIQYIPRNMHTVFALLCFVVVIHLLIFPYPSGLLHWHCGNLTIAPVPAKQPWWIWINISCEFIMNDCITTTEQSTTKPCAYFLGYTVAVFRETARYTCNSVATDVTNLAYN